MRRQAGDRCVVGGSQDVAGCVEQVDRGDVRVVVVMAVQQRAQRAAVMQPAAFGEVLDQHPCPLRVVLQEELRRCAPQ
jgi:hypothetical protein